MSTTGKKPARHVYKTGAAGCGGKAAPTSAKNAGQPLPCPFCDRIFKQDGRLKEHLKNKHADEELQESVVPEDSGQGDQATVTTENVQNPQRDEHGYPIKSPKTLLHEWCQKNKKPQPKFKAVEMEGGGFHCRVILPDSKKSEADVILWFKGSPTRTSMEAQHRASVVALHYVMGNRRLDRVLGEDYKQLWYDLDTAAEERKAYLKLHPPRPKPKPAPVQNELPSVFMSEGNRRLVEDILRGSDIGDDGSTSTSNDQLWSTNEDLEQHLEDDSADTREGMADTGVSGQEDVHPQSHITFKGVPKVFGKKNSLRKHASGATTTRELVDASPKDRMQSQLERYGFKSHHVNAALTERDDLSRALDWLVLNVPESELPAKFAAESSKASVQVLVRGKQLPKKFPGGFADVSSQSIGRLQEYGYPDSDCLAALVETNGDESMALSSLFKALLLDSESGMSKGGEDESVEVIMEMRKEEVVALQSIFEDEAVSLSESFMMFELSLRDDVDISLDMEIRIPSGCRYPYDIPVLAFRSSKLPPDFLLDLTRQVGEFALQMDGPMIFDLVSTATELAQALLINYSSLDEDVPRDTRGLDDSHPEFEAHPDLETIDMTAPGSNNSLINTTQKASTTVNASTTYIPPALRQSQDIRSTNSTSQQNDERGRSEQKNRQGATRFSGERSHTNKNALQNSGIEDFKRNDADIRLESERMKEEWEDWHKAHKHSELRNIRAKLPAHKARSELLRAINSCCVTIVCGQTGCGKSTQVPQYVLEDFIEMNKGGECNIICTQPRRISAIGLADRVAKERGQAVGATVGYSVRLDSRRSIRTRLLFCTTGILLRRLLSDPELIGVSHVIVDEVHERSLESDLLLLLLRRLLQRPQNTLDVILMSATVDSGTFADYFRKNLGHKPPIMNIPGFTFPVRELYLEDAFELTGYRVGRNSRYAQRKKSAPVEDQSDAAGRSESHGILSLTGDIDSWENGLDEQESPDCSGIESYSEITQQSLSIVDQNIINFELIETLVCSIMQQEVDPSTKYGKLTASGEDHERREGKAVPSSSGQRDGAGAILVFLPGMLEIRKLQQRLQSSNQISGLGLGGLWVVALHGSLSGEDQKRVFKRPPSGVRKVVLATNIAETSITIDDVVYVIDTGRHKEMRYDHNRGLSCLEDTWVSKANAKQRRGRAGRVRPGCCFRLFSRQQFQKFDDQQLPEMLRVSLEGLCLRVKSLLSGKVEEIVSQMLTPPSLEAVRTSLKSLEDLNALDKLERLTPLGQHLARMPVDARVGKMLIFGCMLKCLDPILTIAASLSGRSPFMSPMEKREEAMAARSKLAGNSKSDHMAVVAAYNGWLNAKTEGWSSENEFCSANFLSRETLSGIEASRADYLKILVDLGFLSGVADYNVSTSPVNANATSVRVVKALICAGFYPNIVRVLHPEKTYVQTEGGAMVKVAAAHELRFFTKEDGRVFLHPASVNFPVGIFESPWLVFTEKVKTSKVFLRESTMIPAYALLLFGGEIKVKHERQAITVDGWLQFEAPARIAVLIRELRLKVDMILLDKIQQPAVDISSSPVVTALIQLLTNDGF